MVMIGDQMRDQGVYKLLHLRKNRSDKAALRGEYELVDHREEEDRLALADHGGHLLVLAEPTKSVEGVFLHPHDLLLPEALQDLFQEISCLLSSLVARGNDCTDDLNARLSMLNLRLLVNHQGALKGLSSLSRMLESRVVAGKQDRGEESLGINSLKVYPMLLKQED